MAKSPQPSKEQILDDALFEVITPERNDSVPIDPADNTIRAAIRDFNGDAYQATLFDFPYDPDNPVLIGTAQLQQEGTTNVFSARMDVGMPDETGTGPNRVIEFDDLDTSDSIRHAFRAYHDAGSGSSGSNQIAGFSAKYFRPGQLLPVALTLKLDSKVTKGTCNKCAELNRPTSLLHANSASAANGWHSRPIAFCGKGAPPGYWVLQKSSSTTWTLVLRQRDKVLVTFVAKTKPKDGSLPITLHRKGPGNKVCKNWPKTVTITRTV